MSIGDQSERRTRTSRIGRKNQQDSYVLGINDTVEFGAIFGVANEQIEHDFVIWHLLAAIEPLSAKFVFYGGTALSRTVLDGLRLSEDIDLLSVGPRSSLAKQIDNAVTDALERKFGRIIAEPWLSEVANDTQACTFFIGESAVRVQLISGLDYAAWPCQQSRINQRYQGMQNLTLSTFTPEGFVGAKTDAWCDATRNAPRDLYDLWALATRGYINPMAAYLYKRHGAINSFPRRWMFPKKPPTPAQWEDALSHQCIPATDPAEAFETVISSWERVLKGIGEDF